MTNLTNQDFNNKIRFFFFHENRHEAFIIVTEASKFNENERIFQVEQTKFLLATHCFIYSEFINEHIFIVFEILNVFILFFVFKNRFEPLDFFKIDAHETSFFRFH